MPTRIYPYLSESDSTTGRTLLVGFTTAILRKKSAGFCLRIKAGKLEKDVAY